MFLDSDIFACALLDNFPTTLGKIWRFFSVFGDTHRQFCAHWYFNDTTRSLSSFSRPIRKVFLGRSHKISKTIIDKPPSKTTISIMTSNALSQQASICYAPSKPYNPLPGSNPRHIHLYLNCQAAAAKNLNGKRYQPVPRISDQEYQSTGAPKRSSRLWTARVDVIRRGRAAVRKTHKQI